MDDQPVVVDRDQQAARAAQRCERARHVRAASDRRRRGGRRSVRRSSIRTPCGCGRPKSCASGRARERAIAETELNQQMTLHDVRSGSPCARCRSRAGAPAARQHAQDVDQDPRRPERDDRPERIVRRSPGTPRASAPGSARPAPRHELPRRNEADADALAARGRAEDPRRADDEEARALGARIVGRDLVAQRPALERGAARRSSIAAGVRAERTRARCSRS